MKRILLFFILYFVWSYTYAQRKPKFTLELFQTELEQYITKKAGLTPKEAAKFFPLYEEMQHSQRAIHNKLKNLKRFKPATDDECKKNITERDELEIRMKEVQKKYHEEFMQILSAKKVYDIIKAEDKFHRQMFKQSAMDKRKEKKD